MSDVKIWHNPRCSKSRATMALLIENGVDPVVMDYQKTPPSEATLRRVISMLSISARDLIRSGEKAYKELGLSKTSTEDELIAAMIDVPKLIERPIVLKDDKAAIGRPPESVLKIL